MQPAKASRRSKGKAKTSPKVKVDDVFRADDKFIRFMSNRNYVKDFMDAILSTSKMNPVCYQGNFFYSDDENISPLIDEETHDIVSLRAKDFQAKAVKGQSIFNNPLEFFLAHRPINRCVNVYFVGDVHGESIEGGDFEVHWNAFV